MGEWGGAPEQKARWDTDADLVAASWMIRDKEGLDLTAGRGINVRKFIMKPGFGFADHMLAVDYNPVGAVEAKPSGKCSAACPIKFPL